MLPDFFWKKPGGKTGHPLLIFLAVYVYLLLPLPVLFGKINLAVQFMSIAYNTYPAAAGDFSKKKNGMCNGTSTA